MSLRSLPGKTILKQNKITNFKSYSNFLLTKLRIDSNNTKDCKFRSFKFKSFETDPCEECEVKQDVKHILLYCNRGILQESRRIFTNNYKQYVPGFVNLCDDKKLKEILNVQQKCMQ